MNYADKLYWFEKALFYVARYPAYPDDYIKQEIGLQASQLPKDELDRYSEFSTNRRHFIFELMVVYIILSLKNFYFVYYTMLNVDFNHPEANIEPASGDAEFKYICLASNCSRHIETEDNATIDLVSELIKLPAFAICKQDWKWYFNPTQEDQKIALLLDSNFAFVVFLLCVLLPFYMQSTAPIYNVAVKFSSCPTVELHRARRKIWQILDTLAYSLSNFIVNNAREEYTRGGGGKSRHSSNSTKNSSLMTDESSFIVHDISFDHKAVQMELLDPNGSRTTGSTSIPKDYLDNHIAINRTHWWRQKWTRSLATLFPIVFVQNCLLNFASYLVFACYAEHVFSKQHSDFLDTLHRSNCSIWYNRESQNDHPDTAIGSQSYERIREVLDIKHIESQWNWLTISTLILEGIIPVYIMSVTLSLCYFVYLDIKVCIIELEFLLNIAIDCINLNCVPKITKSSTFCDNHYQSRNRDQKGLGLEPRKSTTTLVIGRRMYGSRSEPTCAINITNSTSNDLSKLTSTIFDKLTNTINFDSPILLIKPIDRNGNPIKGKLEARLINQEFAFDLMNQVQLGSKEIDLIARLMEKIHVNYRSLVGLLAEHNPGIEIVMISVYLLNYGLTFISVYFYRNVSDFKQGPLVAISIQWVIVVFFIMVTSSIHADLRKLDHRFWSIVAHTENCRDVKVQHFRCIWRKNLSLVYSDGGLGVKVFKINVTYVRIIQLLFGSATIFALALNRQ